MKSSELFEYQKVNCFRFGYNPIGTPFLFVNIFHVDGLLIDTGQAHMSRAIINAVGNLIVNQIFLTHHHEDHTGNIQLLKKHFNCPVYASARCCEIMVDPPPISFAQKLVWGRRPAYPHLIPKDNFVETENHKFEIIPFNGHASDMVALYEPNEGWLFSADLYVSSYIGYYLKSESIIEQIQSLKTALNLDFEVLFCSHNPQFKDGKLKLEEKLLYLEEFYGQISLLYEEGLNDKEIYKKLKLKEHGFTKLLSNGELSKMNMVKSAIRDYLKYKA